MTILEVEEMGMKPGLEGVAAAETKISLVDGERGRLIYRGHRAEDLARTRSPEEVAFLLWNGTLPDPERFTDLPGGAAGEPCNAAPGDRA